MRLPPAGQASWWTPGRKSVTARSPARYGDPEDFTGQQFATVDGRKQNFNHTAVLCVQHGLHRHRSDHEQAHIQKERKNKRQDGISDAGFLHRFSSDTLNVFTSTSFRAKLNSSAAISFSLV
jgi:hypothetical protein